MPYWERRAQVAVVDDLPLYGESIVIPQALRLVILYGTTTPFLPFFLHMKMLLNVNKNAKIVIESELRVNACFLALMNAFSRYWSTIHANERVFSRNEQHKV